MPVFSPQSMECIQDDFTVIRVEHVQDIVSDLIRGHSFFSSRVWTQTVSWKIPVGLCEESADNMTFKSIEKEDLYNSEPLPMPQMKSPVGPFRRAWKRQEKMYCLLKKVLVRDDGQVFRATDAEIVRALGDVPADEGVSDLSGAEYVYAVKEMFHLRG